MSDKEVLSNMKENLVSLALLLLIDIEVIPKKNRLLFSFPQLELKSFDKVSLPKLFQMITSSKESTFVSLAISVSILSNNNSPVLDIKQPSLNILKIK